MSRRPGLTLPNPYREQGLRETDRRRTPHQAPQSMDQVPRQRVERTPETIDEETGLIPWSRGQNSLTAVDRVRVTQLPPQLGSPKWQHGQASSSTVVVDTAARYRMSIDNTSMGLSRHRRRRIRKKCLFSCRGTALGNMGLNEEEIREELESGEKSIMSILAREETGAASVVEFVFFQTDEFQLVMDLAELPTRARIQAIRALPMTFDEKRNIRCRVLAIKLSKKSLYRTCYTDCSEQRSLSFRRCGANMGTAGQFFVIWQGTLKEIGGTFGSTVLSYFLFLKWLFMFNIFSLLINFSFITLPQILPSSNSINATGFRGLELFTGAGSFSRTVLFYGGYSNGDVIEAKPVYNMQLAYFFTIAAYLVLCGVSLIYSMSKSFQRNFVLSSPVSSGSWRVLCSWDFSVVNEKVIQNHKNNLGVQLKESLAEKRYRIAPSISVRMEQFCFHLISWTSSVGLATGSCAGIYFLCQSNLGDARVSQGSDFETEASSLMLPVVVCLVNMTIPLLFSLINNIEHHSNPRITVYIIILRNVLLKMSILGVLCYYWLTDVPNNISCWESFVGQDVYRLVIVDFLFCMLGSFFGEFLRNVIGTKCVKSLGVPEFDIASNVLDLINAQTLAWIGIYFSPLLPFIQIIKLFIIFYLKKVSLSQNCQPPRRSGKAAQMHTVYIALLFFPSYVGVLAMVGYTVWSLKPSVHCGPFQGLNTTFQAVTLWLDDMGAMPGAAWVAWIFQRVIQNELFFYLITLILLVVLYFLWQVTQGRKLLISSLREQIINKGEDKAFLLNKLQNLQAQKREEASFKPQAQAHKREAAVTGSRPKDGAPPGAPIPEAVRSQKQEGAGPGRSAVQGREARKPRPPQPPPPTPRREASQQPKPPRDGSVQVGQGRGQSPVGGSPGRGRAPSRVECWVENESERPGPTWLTRGRGVMAHSRPQRFPRLEPLPARAKLLPGSVPEIPQPARSRQATRPGSGSPGSTQPPGHHPRPLN